MQGNTVFYLAASQTALGGHKTYFYVYHNMPIEASTNSFKTPIFKGYSGCVLFGIIVVIANNILSQKASENLAATRLFAKTI